MTNSSLEQSPKKLNDKIAISGAEIVLLLLLVIVGIGTWVWVDRVVHLFFHEPNEARLQGKYHVFERQDELLRIQNESHAIEAQLISARIEQVVQNNSMTTISEVYPETKKYAEGSSAPSSLADAIKAYRDARMKEQIARQLIITLDDKLKPFEPQIEAARIRLEDAKESASDRLRWYQTADAFWKRSTVLAITLLVGWLLFGLVRRLVPANAREIMWATQSRLPLLMVTGALFIMLAYQAFEVAGAALAAIVLLLVLLPRLPWPLQTGAGVEAKKK